MIVYKQNHKTTKPQKINQMASYSDYIRQLSYNNRMKNKMSNMDRDTTLFFEKFIKTETIRKLLDCVLDGKKECTILKYDFEDCFYVNEDTMEIIKTPDYSNDKEHYIHRIFSIVHSKHFDNLLTYLIKDIAVGEVSVCFVEPEDEEYSIILYLY